MNNLLSIWYNDLSGLYTQYNYNILQHEQDYSEPAYTQLVKISKANKSKSFMRDLYLFKLMTGNNHLYLIGQLVYKQMRCDYDEIKISDSYLKIYLYDIDSIQFKIRQCIHMMDYLKSIHHYVYVEDWRNYNKINKLCNDIKNNLNNANCLILDINSGINDLMNAYDNIRNASYKGLLITTYIRFISQDIDDENEALISLILNNTSGQLDDDLI